MNDFDKRCRQIGIGAARERVLGAIRAKLRRFEGDMEWVREHPECFTEIKSADAKESLRLWRVAFGAVLKAKR